jgi:hypothetical protein
MKFAKTRDPETNNSINDANLWVGCTATGVGGAAGG